MKLNSKEMSCLKGGIVGGGSNDDDGGDGVIGRDLPKEKRPLPKRKK